MNFPRLQEAMDFVTKNTSFTELGRFSEVLLVTACSSAKARVYVTELAMEIQLRPRALLAT